MFSGPSVFFSGVLLLYHCLRSGSFYIENSVNILSLVVAPRVTNHSTAWTKGKVHRDFEDFNWKGVYSFMLFLDEVNVDNGAIEFWPKSKQMPVDKQNPERTLKMTGWTSEIVTGPKATVMAWDAFVLHRSLPNKTEKQRLTLQWFVTTMRGPTIIFA
jgi:ectoine hydroxylase-related dioxygenase (phytanoyl-CoA dioxygenase family)